MRAMKTDIIQYLKELWSGKKARGGIRSFTEDQENEAAFDTVQRGTRCVPLSQIVGSVGRYHDFDDRFQPLDHMPTDRFNGIKKAMREGRRIPPVKLYQIKDEFYVLDGNHRIAAAKALGRSDIDGKIVEFIPSKETLENLIYRQRSRFSEVTGLRQAVNLTEVGQYDYLLEQIRRHRTHMSKGGGEISMEAAASDWYDSIYRPLSAIIRKGNLIRFFPDRSQDDLYAYVSYQQWERGRKRKYGIGIDRLIPRDMEAFRAKMASKKETEYPEMLREITAFVLINVKGKSERRLMDKLYHIKEVREIHSIHGNVDILLKVVLTRDLLSSDAEIISDFVYRELRQLTGIISTQTLIPGQSMIKEP